MSEYASYFDQDTETLVLDGGHSVVIRRHIPRRVARSLVHFLRDNGVIGQDGRLNPDLGPERSNLLEQHDDLLLAAYVVRWSYVRPGGSPLPVAAESCGEIPEDHAQAIVAKINEIRTGTIRSRDDQVNFRGAPGLSDSSGSEATAGPQPLPDRADVVDAVGVASG